MRGDVFSKAAYVNREIARSVERGTRVMASEQIQEDLVEEIVRRYKNTLAGLAKY